MHLELYGAKLGTLGY